MLNFKYKIEIFLNKLILVKKLKFHFHYQKKKIHWFMKYFYYIILFFIVTGCQQQQVPEVFYDLDAQSMTNKTRAIQQNILYKAPLDMVINKELKLFHGNLSYLDSTAEDEDRQVEIKLKNDMGVILELEVSPQVAGLMHLEMELVVRYMRDEKKNTVIEIKKATW